jgi:DNA-3-methyladenine glycosylase
VLIKSGYPFPAFNPDPRMIQKMQSLNPRKYSNAPRGIEALCGGQTLLCKSLGIKVPEWDQRDFNKNQLFINNSGYSPKTIINARRLGITIGRDEELLYRFIDYDFARFATSNPLTKKAYQNGSDYRIINL